MIDSAKAIKSMRIKRNLSVLELSKLSGCAYKSIYLWESGSVNISLANFERVMNAMGCEIVFYEVGNFQRK